jgi:hypothetical protein
MERRATAPPRPESGSVQGNPSGVGNIRAPTEHPRDGRGQTGNSAADRDLAAGTARPRSSGRDRRDRACVRMVRRRGVPCRGRPVRRVGRVVPRGRRDCATVTAVESFTPVVVSYHQFQVGAAADPYDNLDLYTMGDDLLQVTGRGQLTVLTGPHTGPVEVRCRVLPSAPDGDLDGWHGAAECTTWCPDGRVVIGGLMGDAPDQLRTTVSERPSLLRARVLVRNRRPEDQAPDPLAPEQ